MKKTLERSRSVGCGEMRIQLPAAPDAASGFLVAGAGVPPGAAAPTKVTAEPATGAITDTKSKNAERQERDRPLFHAIADPHVAFTPFAHILTREQDFKIMAQGATHSNGG